MSARIHKAEQFMMPMPVAATKPTIGQMRESLTGMINRLLVLAGHPNQVVTITRERLEQIACVAPCGPAVKGAIQVDWIIQNEPARAWARRLPSRRWRARLALLCAFGERVIMAEIEAAPNAKRTPVLPPPEPARCAAGGALF